MLLTLGIVVAALGGLVYVARISERKSTRRFAIGAVVAAAGAAVSPALMRACAFEPERTAVDHILAYALMAAGAWLGLIAAKTYFERQDGKADESEMTGEIKAGGFRLGWWVPWALLSPTLLILVVFLYTPAFQTFALGTKLTRLAAPRAIPVCFGNFSELLISDPVRLLAYPFIAVAFMYGVRLWTKRALPGSSSHKLAEVFSVFATLAVFIALYAIFSAGGDGGVKYRPVFVNTVIISAGIVALGMSGGLALAYLAFRKIRGGGVYRTLLIWPYAISPAVAGILFFMLLDPTAGIVGHLAKDLFGVTLPNYRESAILAQAAIIMASAWKILGYNILFYLAGLQTVPIDQIEAAVLDGATPWQRFRHIVLAALSPITFFLLVTNLTYAFFEVFATIDYMTKGAPAGATSVSIYEIIRVGVDNGDLGRGAAQSVLLFIAVIAVTVWQFRTSGRRVSYGGG